MQPTFSLSFASASDNCFSTAVSLDIIDDIRLLSDTLGTMKVESIASYKITDQNFNIKNLTKGSTFEDQFHQMNIKDLSILFTFWKKMSCNVSV